MFTPSFLAYSTSSRARRRCRPRPRPGAAPPPPRAGRGCLAARFRPEDLGHPPRGMPPTPMAASRLMAPVGIASTRTRVSAAHPHDRALPQVFFDLRNGEVERPCGVVGSCWSLAFRLPWCSSTWYGPLSMRPEYTPKPAQRQAGAEGVFQVLELAVAQADGVEAVDVAGLPEAVHQPGRPAPAPAAFSPVIASMGAARTRRPSALHFHERHHAAAPRHDVDLDPPILKRWATTVHPWVRRYCDRLLFSREPALVRSSLQSAGSLRRPLFMLGKLAVRRRIMVPKLSGWYPFNSLRIGDCGLGLARPLSRGWPPSIRNPQSAFRKLGPQISSSSSNPTSTSRGFGALAGPRIPASSSWSMMRAARRYRCSCGAAAATSEPSWFWMHTSAAWRKSVRGRPRRRARPSRRPAPPLRPLRSPRSAAPSPRARPRSASAASGAIPVDDPSRSLRSRYTRPEPASARSYRGRNSMSPLPHRLGAVLVENRAAVDFGGDAERDAAGKNSP